jgi:hypothetical protein
MENLNKFYIAGIDTAGVTAPPLMLCLLARDTPGTDNAIGVVGSLSIDGEDAGTLETVTIMGDTLTEVLDRFNDYKDTIIPEGMAWVEVDEELFTSASALVAKMAVIKEYFKIPEA